MAADDGARVAVERLLERWDDDEATALFAMNVDLDEPLALRRAEIERLARGPRPLPTR